MVKKIIYSIIALTIIYFGYNSFNRLRFWDRSVQIFKMNSNQPFGRGGFERGGRELFNPNNTGARTARPEFRNFPDSIRQQFTQREIPVQQDSLRQRNRSEMPQTDFNSFRGRGGFEGRDQQRGGFSRRNVRLNTVYHFLAVFAALTVVTIYIDKAIKTRRKRKTFKAIEAKN